MATTINASTSSGLVETADTSGQLELQSNGITQLTVSSTGAYGQLKSATAQASTSGTSIDFTGIPSWVKRVTVMFNGVSTSGTSAVQIQIGSTTFSTSGYASTSSFTGAVGGYIFASTGFFCDPQSSYSSGASRSGFYQLTLLTSNTWVGSGNISAGSSIQVTNACAGNSPALGGTLDRIRITTVGGTDTFDAGSINIMYEG